MPAGARAATAAVMVLLLAACGSTSGAPDAAPSGPGPSTARLSGPGADGPGADRPGTDRPSTDRPSTDRPGTDRPGTGRSGTGGSGAVVPPGAAPVAPPAPEPVPTRAGRRPVVVLDPGHNGANAANPAAVGRLVDAGNGTRKACNTVGASTAAGYPEHALNWDLALRTRAVLRAAGVDVRFTRPHDSGVGPCVDARGRYGNAHRADAVVSVHADGADPAGSGFHLIEAARAPGGADVAAAGHRLTLAVRAALLGSGLDHADYVAGGDGLDVRDDLALLNLSTRPTVLVECGNMRNPVDAARLSAPAGRQRIAAALAAGILDFLRGAGSSAPGR